MKTAEQQNFKAANVEKRGVDRKEKKREHGAHTPALSHQTPHWEREEEFEFGFREWIWAEWFAWCV